MYYCAYIILTWFFILSVLQLEINALNMHSYAVSFDIRKLFDNCYAVSDFKSHSQYLFQLWHKDTMKLIGNRKKSYKIQISFYHWNKNDFSMTL